MVWTRRGLAVASVGLVSCVMLCVAPAGAHDPVRFDARRATPGVSLELVELAPATAGAVAKYRLRVTGLPRGVVFGVWTNEFGHGFHEQASGFKLDESGALVSNEIDGAGRSRRLDEMSFEPGPLPRGAGWDVAIVSLDRSITAFAKAIPRPIMARVGSCVVSLELASRRGDRFIASGAGFGPGEPVVVELKYADQASQKAQLASADGLLPRDFIQHGGGGGNGDHRARYAVKSRSCEVAVEYEWGEPALSTR